MAYNFNTIQAAVNQKLLPTVTNNIFVETNFLLAKLKQNYKTYNERKIIASLEYAKSTNVGFVGRGGTIPISNEEILTSATFAPSMFYGTFTILKQDELENTSDLAVVNLLQTKIKNLQKSMEDYMASYIYTRGTAIPTAPNWNTVDNFVNNSSSIDVGDILSSGTVPTWWRSSILTSASFTGDTTSETDLLNPNKDCYVIKLLQRGIALCINVGGQKPDCIIVPQYIFDMIETILNAQKLGSAMSVMVGDIGFTALNFRGIPIVSEYYLVYNQTSDIDGRIYFLNTKFLYMYLNSNAAFKMEDFVRDATSFDHSAPIGAYGNLAITCRRAQASIQDLYSPKGYVGL